MGAAPTQPATAVILCLTEPSPTTKEQRELLTLDNTKAPSQQATSGFDVFPLILPLSPAKTNTLGPFLITLSFCSKIQWSAW